MATELNRSPVLILGASTRAAAQSAIRAGLRPICADLFADLDLRGGAQVVEVADYPHGLAAAAASVPPCPWMYTGGLENHPRLVERIAETRPLWGNGPDVLRRVRNPWNVQRLLEEAGLPTLRIWSRQSDSPPADETWMQKPLRGAAGRGIRVWHGDTARRAPLREAHYFQERRSGSPVSAIFLATAQETALMGMTRQLVGLSEVHAPPFAWCGTIAPIRLPDAVVDTISRMGQILASRCGVRGLFGCDFLSDGEQAWLTEVNPRYPASTEIIEQILQAPLLDWHRRVFVVPPSGSAARKPPEGGPTNVSVLGKIILYADRDLVAPDLARFVARPSCWLDEMGACDRSLPYVADIPMPGQPISCGRPICTLFARGSDEDECLAELINRAVHFALQVKS
jgi:predicted ATP-grasp superfamily ATP-dependent carboligase